MVFGGLSLNEFENIVKVLDELKIEYQSGGDNQFIIFNNESMKDDIRHLKGSTLSAHIYSITIPEDVLESISSENKERLHLVGLHWGDEPEFEKEILESAPQHPQMMMRERRDQAFGKTYRIVMSIGAFIYLLIIIYNLMKK